MAAPFELGQAAKPRSSLRNLDHPGLVVNEPTIGPLARLGLARAYRLHAKKLKRGDRHRDFLLIGKDGDPEIPVLIPAKSEAAVVQ